MFVLHLSLVALTTTALGCPRPSNQTTQKGVGGLPIQKMDVSTDTGPQWEVPKDLQYTGMEQMYPDNNRIFLVSDSVDKVVEYYMGKLPGAVQESVNGKRHIKVKNDDITIDIERGDSNTKIAFLPQMLHDKDK